MHHYLNSFVSNLQQVQPVNDDTFNAFYQRNLNAIRRHIPSLASQVLPTTARWELVDVWLEPGKRYTDLVELETVHTFYGLDANQQVLNNTRHFLEAPSALTFLQTVDADNRLCIICGLGAGWHLSEIINSQRYTHIIVYEPEVELLSLSLNTLDWESALNTAHAHNIQLFFQINHSGQQLLNDLAELQQHQVSFNAIDVYKHTNNAVFNAIYAMTQRQHSRLFTQDCQRTLPSTLPAWGNLYGKTVTPLANSDSAKRNQAVITKYYPEVAHQAQQYQDAFWSLSVVAQRPCLTNQLFGCCLLDAYTEAHFAQAQHAFVKQPIRDDIATNFTSAKHAHYLHHRLLKRLSVLTQDAEKDAVNLPQKLSALVILGLGPGFGLPALYQAHDIEQLIICESQWVYFQLSMHTCDWVSILQHCANRAGNVYLNIGGTGQDISDDLMTRFGQKGQYALAQTYFYRPYHNVDLAPIFNQLRENLRASVITGEYFDYALHGLAHTQYSVEHNHAWLTTTQHAASAYRDIPVFIVGNGPSLDSAIDTLKQQQGHVIIVSCGTSLPALVNNGIIPDMHADIELNYATYSWIRRHVSPEVTKQMTIISCNGLHPMTSQLFKRTLLAVKSAESSSHYYFNHLKGQVAHLDFAYPTVSNFAFDFIATAGFKDIYLVGTDFGFVQEGHHHSTHSGYYNQAKQAQVAFQDPSCVEQHIAVAGNFRPSVFTKFEFKFAVDSLQRSIAQHQVNVYNTSDGAKIEGAFALPLSDVLWSPIDKTKGLAEFIQTGFIPSQHLALPQAPSTRFFAEQCYRLLLTDTALNQSSDMYELVAYLYGQLKRNGHQQNRLPTYLLQGTFNVFATVLLKHPDWFHNREVMQRFAQEWHQFIVQSVAHVTATATLPWDTTLVFAEELIPRCLEDAKVSLANLSPLGIQSLVNTHPLLSHCECVDASSPSKLATADCVIVQNAEEQDIINMCDASFNRHTVVVIVNAAAGLLAPDSALLTCSSPNVTWVLVQEAQLRQFSLAHVIIAATTLVTRVKLVDIALLKGSTFDSRLSAADKVVSHYCPYRYSSSYFLTYATRPVEWHKNQLNSGECLTRLLSHPCQSDQLSAYQCLPSLLVNAPEGPYLYEKTN